MDTAKTTCGTKVQTTRSQEGTDIYLAQKEQSNVSKYANVWVCGDFSRY